MGPYLVVCMLLIQADWLHLIDFSFDELPLIIIDCPHLHCSEIPTIALNCLLWIPWFWIAIKIACYLDINCLIFVDVGVNFHLSTTLSHSRDSPLVPSPLIIQNWISEKSFILFSERVGNRDFRINYPINNRPGFGRFGLG